MVFIALEYRNNKLMTANSAVSNIICTAHCKHTIAPIT